MINMGICGPPGGLHSAPEDRNEKHPGHFFPYLSCHPAGPVHPRGGHVWRIIGAVLVPGVHISLHTPNYQILLLGSEMCCVCVYVFSRICMNSHNNGIKQDFYIASILVLP